MHGVPRVCDVIIELYRILLLSYVAIYLASHSLPRYYIACYLVKLDDVKKCSILKNGIGIECPKGHKQVRD